MQLFHLVFTQPRALLLEHPCMSKVLIICLPLRGWRPAPTSRRGRRPSAGEAETASSAAKWNYAAAASSAVGGARRRRPHGPAPSRACPPPGGTDPGTPKADGEDRQQVESRTRQTKDNLLWRAMFVESGLQDTFLHNPAQPAQPIISQDRSGSNFNYLDLRLFHWVEHVYVHIPVCCDNAT